ncbi:hypothetical protein BCR34DRAFT_652631 [Clohesyomyces aquaticus]|uniref:Uncharacterized protein n=1 Tax=Clohesyomyces aquaticus TaxID=1231657 RepID=A0A1Y2A977_9PLEO|nr:hypothetical protein BCR34DRAFT_652631 [Clohesyomyces aquaticus]
MDHEKRWIVVRVDSNAGWTVEGAEGFGDEVEGCGEIPRADAGGYLGRVQGGVCHDTRSSRRDVNVPPTTFKKKTTPASSMPSNEHVNRMDETLIGLSNRLRERMTKQRKMLDLFERTKLESARVEASEWDELAKEFDEVDLVPIKGAFMREEWPQGVPYLNLVALQKWVDSRMAV